MGIHFFILYVITKINLKFRKFKYNNLFIKFIFFNIKEFKYFFNFTLKNLIFIYIYFFLINFLFHN